MTSVLPPVTENPATLAADLERDFLLQNYTRYPLTLARGKGCYLYDTQGRRYLDFITGIGVNALGYAHPRMTKVVREQAGLLIHSSNLFYHEYQGRLAKRLVEMTGLQRVFFANTGSESVELALKMIHSHGRAIHPDKYEIVALNNSFHGRTMGALSVTGQAKYRADFEPLIPGVKFIDANNVEALESAFDNRTAGMILELIQGEGGIQPITPEFAAKARELSDRHNALLVADETQCGVGRPGTYFAYQRADQVILPDIMVAAKPLACGIPLGVVVGNEKAAAAIRPGMHGSTFGGGPLACRAALEFLEILDELLPSIRRVGAYFYEQLQALAAKFKFVREVRGFGLMLGMDLAIPGKQIVLDAMADGLLINCTHDTVLRFLPPYIATEKEVDRALRILRGALSKAKARQDVVVPVGA
jgi:acetylornithine/N-succinyldiaminopimelate aminotransferase